MINEGQRNDITCAIPVLDQIKDIEGSQVLADRGYDSQKLIDYIYDRGAEPMIPSRKGEKYERKYDWWLYKERHLAENLFLKLKGFCRIVTRYDKLACTYLGFLCIALVFLGITEEVTSNGIPNPTLAPIDITPTLKCINIKEKWKMYSSICKTFLDDIRAIRFYVDNVEQTTDDRFDKNTILTNEAFNAAIIYLIVQGKKHGIVISDLPDVSESLESMSQDALNYLKEMEAYIEKIINEVKEKDIQSYLPKGIKKEYQKIEIRGKQKEILYRGALLLLVTYFENLIARILRENFIKYPQRISLDEKTVSYKMLTEINNIDDIRNILIDQEVTSKMYESLMDWKRYFQKNLKLCLKAWDDEFQSIQEIIARRNLYVHNNGIINNIYLDLVKTLDKDALGEILNIDREYIDNALDTIEYIGMTLVIEAWIKEHADNQEEVKAITDMIYEEYLEPQRWEMARHFYEICLQSSKLLIADKILCKINSWQCYKWLGEYDKVKKEVEKLDVSAYLPRYQMGILALKEQYEDFFRCYDNQSDIGESELKEWPLFMELRKSKQYMERYSKEQIVEKQQIECEDAEDVTD